MLDSVTWSASELDPKAKAVSASRRTDIPALFAPWFARRFEQGFAEYVPLGPPRRIRCSLRPEMVTHFNFWTKWPRPFVPVLEQVLSAGYPVLWNVTITGLGATAVEPHVPAAPKVLNATAELAKLVSPAAICWRYDPVFLSKRYDEVYHEEAFLRLAERLTGSVDRVVISFVTRYKRQVEPDLRAYQGQHADVLADPSIQQQVEVAGRLARIAAQMGIELTVCCDPQVREAIGCEPAGCNSYDWALRVYPQLSAHRRLRKKPCRADCACSEEVDIGVYDTCVLGCRYSYGSCSVERARQRFSSHDPQGACLLP